jgi:hypothetical protein
VGEHDVVFTVCVRYSAAHEYFMSNSQAVYVIVFSVMEERDCMLQQVACALMWRFVGAR